ncbi:MAG TPA: sensor histidine kinase [Candidatus Eisenbacteria bacterium]|nr:sensor histidine kinase [Candidatus Eisenbacteria bacterium]
MDRTTVELSGLGFQAAITAILALVYLVLWRRQRRAYFLTWGAAWGMYALRLAFISSYVVTRREAWLFAHQAATDFTALLLLGAALQFSRGFRLRPRHLGFAALGLAWSAFETYGIHDMRVAGTSASVLLSTVTLWNGIVFWRHAHRVPSGGARLLAWTFVLWGVHHLDYPLLRAFGSGVLWGVFADVTFIVVASLGTLFLVLGEERRALATRTAQLEQLTRQLMRAQEDERRRIARELHDEAGQVLTALKIDLDLEGRREASELVGRALAQVRDLSNLLRPAVLDDLGLTPALRGLVDDFARRTRIAVALEMPERPGPLTPEQEVAIYRVVQEALTNVARHAGAREVRVRLEPGPDALRVAVEDDGCGVRGEPVAHLGLLGMRERLTALGGSLAIGPGGNGMAKGFRLEAEIPTGAAS